METQSSPVEMNQEQVRRIRIGSGGYPGFDGSHVCALDRLCRSCGSLRHSSRGRYVAVVLLVFVVFSGISLWLIRRQRLGRAIAVYYAGRGCWSDGSPSIFSAALPGR